jgi:hypothetical protein
MACKTTRNVLKIRRKRMNRRMKKQSTLLIEVMTNPPNIRLWSWADVQKVHLVFNGAIEGDTTHFLPSSKPWKCLSIRDGDLFIPSYPPLQRGLTFPRIYGQSLPSPFILIPRADTLQRLSRTDIPGLWNSLSSIEKSHRISTARGVPIFGHSKYVGCVGSQVKRSGVGIRITSHSNHIGPESWDSIVDYVITLENLFSDFVDASMLSMIRQARELVQYSTISRLKCHSLHKDGKIFGAFAFGKNVHLPAHVDNDFTYSLVSVHKNLPKYETTDNVVIYFCFPRLGVAVPMKPGDSIIFNPQEPHAASSRCYESDEILCMSLYLKTTLVGLNDNSIPNTPQEMELIKKYNSIK